MSDITTLMMAAAGGGVEETDPNFNQTVLLLHGDGTNGAQNNTFLDSSTNNFTITRNGNTTQGTFSPFSQPDGRWSNYFDGATATRLTFASSTDFAFGTGAYTVEALVYVNARATYDQIVLECGSATNSAGFALSNSGQVVIGKYGVGNVVSSTAGDVPLNEWVYVSWVRTSTSSNDTRLYVNGVLVATGTDNNDWTVTTTPAIGGINISGYTLNGYIANLRVIKGSAVTPSSVPTSPLSTSTSNQKLLTCYSNRFVDANTATTAKAITVNGVKVTPFSPFAPTAAYDASVNGGSGYFDGTGDYLDLTDNGDLDYGTGDFTVEAWVYPTTGLTTSNLTIIDTRPISGTPDQGYYFYVNTSSKLVFGWQDSPSSANYTSSASLVPFQWSHVAATRSGDTLRVFINGSVENTSDVSGKSFVASIFRIGNGTSTGTSLTFWNGYLASLRCVKGTAAYTSAFTPSTSPLTAISGTSLLCNFTNAGIYDNTGKNNLETVGNAQVDTSTKKYGTGSLEFDGTGDGLFRPFTQDLNFGTGDFTIEWWMYYNSKTGYQTIMSFGYSPQVSTGWLIQTGDGDGKIVFYTQSAGTTIASDTGATVNTGEWYHMAVVRSSGTTTIYRNGTSVGSGSDTTNYTATAANFYVGGGSSTAFNNFYFNGFIDDLRITKGVARYTTTFTPPDAPFLDQ